ncbi:hypothetical protein PMAYCL1PPCAC_08203, partial [Pristionchus mayeri]
IFTSIVSISTVFYTARNYLHRTIFENVTKELIIALYVYIAFYSVCLIFAQGSQLVYRYLATQKCDAQVPKAWCIFRYILTVITLTFGLIHVGITLQFLLSSLHFGKRALKVTTRLSIAASFLFTLISAVISYYKESLEGRTPYCTGWTQHSEGVRIRLAWLHFCTITILKNLYECELNGERQKSRNSFDLSLSFHRRQILYAMEQFLPVAVLNALFYLVFFCTTFVSRMIKSSMSQGWYLFMSVVVSMFPHYCYLCPLCFLILIKRGHFKRVSRLYFSALKDQWN